MTTQLSVTTTQRIAAQEFAYQLALHRDKWKHGDESLFLMPPKVMAEMLKDCATLDRTRAHFQHGADESLWPTGTPLDEVVGRLVAQARLEK